MLLLLGSGQLAAGQVLLQYAADANKESKEGRRLNAHTEEKPIEHFGTMRQRETHMTRQLAVKALRASVARDATLTHNDALIGTRKMTAWHD